MATHKRQVTPKMLKAESMNTLGTIYVIEFSTPIGNITNPRGYSKFYVGWCKSGEEERRLHEHRTGLGAKITAWAAANGIQFDIVYTEPGTKLDELAIKNRANTPKWINRKREQGLTRF